VGKIIAEVDPAMEFHADSEDVARTSHPHPDAAGGPLRQAAMGIDG
jgi:hypothetical protein